TGGDPRYHLPPAIVINGLLAHIKPGEAVPEHIEEVLSWFWSITGEKRLAHVVLTAPQSMTVDGGLSKVKALLNHGRPSPGALQLRSLSPPSYQQTLRHLQKCLPVVLNNYDRSNTNNGEHHRLPISRDAPTTTQKRLCHKRPEVDIINKKEKSSSD
ncbi:unnamed protein product, partial [Choristocarpus tenellus]